MSLKITYDTPEAHKFFGIELNMKTWDLLGKKNRTDVDNDMMIHAAHGSYYHWSIGGTPTNFTRAEWLLSHVYAVLGKPEPALSHARRALKICLDNKIGDFDLAYAHEAMARALACNG